MFRQVGLRGPAHGRARRELFDALMIGRPLTPAHSSARGELVARPLLLLSRSFVQTPPSLGLKRTSLDVTALPQGAVPLEPVALDDGAARYPTVIAQARQNMSRFDNCVLLTRVGGFYELYFEQAEELGPLLNLKVGRKKTNAGPVSMAGFPFFQLDRFLKILVKDLNRYVAIAEEFPHDPAGTVKTGGLLHDRKVSRIVTPGTLIDEPFMDPFANNYVLAVHLEKDALSIMTAESPDEGIPLTGQDQLRSMLVGLAWLDLSTGQFFTQTAPLESLSSAVSRIGPSEIILNEALRSTPEHLLSSLIGEEGDSLNYCSDQDSLPISEWSSVLEVEIPRTSAALLTESEVAAGGVLLKYVATRLQALDLKLQPPVRYEATGTMEIDRNSMRALEIRETIRDGTFRGSLLHAVRRTVTKGGARLLNEWLSGPSTSLDIINNRLDLVSCMREDRLLRETVVGLLRHSHDTQRLVQKFSLGRGDPDDALALASTISVTQELVSTLRRSPEGACQPAQLMQRLCLERMISRIQLSGPTKLVNDIKSTIDEEGLVQQHRIAETEAEKIISLAHAQGMEVEMSSPRATAKGVKKSRPTSLREHYMDTKEIWIMKPAANRTLQKLHRELDALKSEKSELEGALKAQLGAASLSLRWTPGLGHICHVKGKDTDIVGSLRSVSSSRSTKSFYESKWTALGQRIDQAKVRIQAEEQQVFLRLRKEIVRNLAALRQNAAVLDELDVASSLATLAEEQNLVRPILNNSTAHKIINGRHPTVQGGLRQQGRNFVANNCFVGDQEDIWLITGPNMGGKSTFLRQNALVTILAQMGSYVPADYAEIGIVDRVFSRVGSADSLYHDQSTFMVEMLETASILRNATSRSFVIMDEIGRGTTPTDGVAVAYAALHHLYHTNRCRTLFATHFHSLADLSRDMPRVGYYCTDVVDDGKGGFSFVHKLKQGINRESHALKVAQLAGMPESALAVARHMVQQGIEGRG